MKNRLTKVINPGSQNVQYEYDALGRRTKRTENTNVTKFTYDGMDVVLDDNTATGITKYQNGLGIDNKLKLINGSTAKYFLQDHLGSTNALTDQSGNIIQSAVYDSFGNSTNTLGTRYQFTGREKDDFSGLIYYRARWYDTNLGKFISEDPIGFDGGDINLFGYVRNNPVNKNDPLGLIDPIIYQNPNIYEASYNYGCPNTGLGVLGINDFLINYSDMRKSNTVGADKFFHCMANCQSSRRGSFGNFISNIIGEGREFFDQYAKGDSPEDCNQDRVANQTGRFGGISCLPCEQVCFRFRPSSLTYPLPEVPKQSTDGCENYGSWRCK